MNCKFCHSEMTLEDNTDYACDNCGSTYNVGGESWTNPVECVNCVACLNRVDASKATHTDHGVICKECLEIDNRVPKFHLGQNIWYMMNNRPCSAKVSSKCTIANSHDSWACTKEQKDSWQHFGATGISYVTCHGVIKEGNAFGSKEELLKSL